VNRIELALTDVLTAVVDNRGRSCPTVSSGFPLIATNCVKDDRLYPTFDNVRYIDEDTYTNWFRGHPEPGDILFVCKGSPGRVALVPDPVGFAIAQDMLSLRANAQVVDNRYLFYVLRSRDVRDKIVNMHVGTMIPHFKKGDFGKLRFTIHTSLDEQRSIAGVLGALDDKIATNAKVASSAFGLAGALAVGVQARSGNREVLGAIATTVLGGTPSRERPEFWSDGSVPWLNSGTANADRILEPTQYITEEALELSAAKLMPAGATVIAITGATLGQVARLELDAAGNQSLVGAWSDDPAMNDWLHFAIREAVPELLKRATGAAQQHVNKRDVDGLLLPVPSEDDLLAFHAQAGPLLSIAANADWESRTLAKLRDTLLPELMSGRLRVKDAEKKIEEVV